MKSIISVSMLLALFLFIFSCRSDSETREAGGSDAGVDDFRAKIVQKALEFEGKTLFSTVRVNGKSFKLDCVGAVSAVFYALGIDLTKDFYKYSGNGVSRLYQTLKERKLLYNGEFPRPGDLIFWDNTWDKNNNQWFGDDPLTHAGIIIKADRETGTIHYLHANYYKNALTINVLNLHKPDVYRDEEGNILNDILFSTTSLTKNEPLKLGGQLYNDSGFVTEEF